MQSISKAQASLGKNFDVGGTAKTGAIELNSVEAVMLEGANQFMRLAIARINQRKKVDRGNLSDIEVSAIVTGKQIGRASCRERVCLYV